MDKIKLLTIAVLALLLLNLGTIGFLMLAPKPHGRGEGPKKLIIEKLHFDQKQQAEYEKLIQWHRGQIDQLDDRIVQSRNQLYTLLLHAPVDNKAKDSLITNINSYQKQIEMTHFKHFEDIKKLCKPEQIEYYNHLTKELARLFSKPRHRR